MNKRTATFILALGILILLGGLYRARLSRPHNAAQKTLPAAPLVVTQSPSSQVAPDKKIPGTALRTPAASSSNSVPNMADILFQFTRRGVPLKDLVNYLEVAQLAPLVTHNSNPYSGEMAIVRARRPLTGTRYFHAQYFSNQDGSSFVQHMSFEIKPGPTAMRDTVAAVRSSFSLTEPPQTHEGYALWHLNNGYILWVKKMAASDLQDDPYNAYSANDAGTIRVAIEAEIH